MKKSLVVYDLITLILNLKTAAFVTMKTPKKRTVCIASLLGLGVMGMLLLYPGWLKETSPVLRSRLHGVEIALLTGITLLEGTTRSFALHARVISGSNSKHR